MSERDSLTTPTTGKAGPSRANSPFFRIRHYGATVHRRRTSDDSPLGVNDTSDSPSGSPITPLPPPLPGAQDMANEQPSFLWGEAFLLNTQNVGTQRALVRQFTTVSILMTNEIARDHMSNERTMLSYIRSAISLTAAGVGALCRKPRLHLHGLIVSLGKMILRA